MGVVSRATTTVPAVDPELERRLRRIAQSAERMRRERDATIVEAFLGGAGLREIARAVNLTHPGVKAILDKYAEDPELMKEHAQRRAASLSKRAFRREREERWKRERPE